MEVRSPSVSVKDTKTGKGRGVFSRRAYAAGETVEDCPAVLFKGLYAQIPDAVRKLLYHWTTGADGAKVHCLALGYGSLYNHANPAKMRYEVLAHFGILRFVAVRPIARGEELTSNYNAVSGEYQSDEDVWFTRMGITPL